MDIDRVEELIAKPVLSVGDKKEIREAADAAGIEYVIKQGCRDCYEKLLVRLYEIADKSCAVSLDGYMFRRRSMAFRVGGVLYSNATISKQRVGNLHPVIIKAKFVRATEEPKPNIINVAIHGSEI